MPCSRSTYACGDGKRPIKADTLCGTLNVHCKPSPSVYHLFSRMGGKSSGGHGGKEPLAKRGHMPPASAFHTLAKFCERAAQRAASAGWPAAAAMAAPAKSSKAYSSVSEAPSSGEPSPGTGTKPSAL